MAWRRSATAPAPRAATAYGTGARGPLGSLFGARQVDGELQKLQLGEKMRPPDLPGAADDPQDLRAPLRRTRVFTVFCLRFGASEGNVSHLIECSTPRGAREIVEDRRFNSLECHD